MRSPTNMVRQKSMQIFLKIYIQYYTGMLINRLLWIWFWCFYALKHFSPWDRGKKKKFISKTFRKMHQLSLSSLYLRSWCPWPFPTSSQSSSQPHGESKKKYSFIFLYSGNARRQKLCAEVSAVVFFSSFYCMPPSLISLPLLAPSRQVVIYFHSGLNYFTHFPRKSGPIS